MLSPEYYRAQATVCLRMSHMSSDRVLTDRLNLLAAEFLAAAEDSPGDPEPRSSVAPASGPADFLEPD